ncbi:aminoglycoside phosphotransferase (APT) family kinase protein [Streptosporangium becharense]|uniref:Aminoglycoside phosphotransferase (APT) family kinase protein n=1 Tax=Streptosporangium becharense TaxID=1816182 RepID=A0A7W9MJT6_9ACTN|nr:aminoglycoside phosphotransferase family protein [Streptosporangium becharense]MBB5822824.1 aminoglycoside phosphotransferase (APT) family kinase protein [Streptosporangium becharense]
MPAPYAARRRAVDQWFTYPVDSDDLIDELHRIGLRYGGAPGTVLPTRPDVIILRAGPVVVKAHNPGAEPEALAERMRAAAHPALRGILLRPVTEEVFPVGDRLVTVWPAGTPVDHGDPDAAPWEDAARLLARLHAVPAGDLPPLRAAGGPARVASTVARLDGGSAAELVVRRAFTTLPEPGTVAGDGPGTLTHGDWHMGQLVRAPGEWILIDIDDLGLGDPAWDLARPAAWFAAGLLDPAVWHRFLDAYRSAGGTAVPPAGDPWERLEIPAQAMTVQLTAAAVATAEREGRPLDEVEQILVDACLRIVQFRDARHRVPTQ